MELATVEIRLRGSVANTVIRQNITPAELILLREMHGEECIADIRYTGKKNIIHADELDRMRGFYKSENAKPLMEKLFPGVSPTLPTTFKEVGYNIGEDQTLRNARKMTDQHENELMRKVKEAAALSGGKPEDVQVIELGR